MYGKLKSRYLRIINLLSKSRPLLQTSATLLVLHLQYHWAATLHGMTGRLALFKLLCFKGDAIIKVAEVTSSACRLQKIVFYHDASHGLAKGKDLSSKGYSIHVSINWGAQMRSCLSIITCSFFHLGFYLYIHTCKLLGIIVNWYTGEREVSSILSHKSSEVENWAIKDQRGVH